VRCWLPPGRMGSNRGNGLAGQARPSRELSIVGFDDVVSIHRTTHESSSMCCLAICVGSPESPGDAGNRPSVKRNRPRSKRNRDESKTTVFSMPVPLLSLLRTCNSSQSVARSAPTFRCRSIARARQPDRSLRAAASSNRSSVARARIRSARG
jgi:hypothetical protein